MYKCKSCGNINHKAAKACPKCGDPDPSYTKEIEKLEDRVNMQKMLLLKFPWGAYSWLIIANIALAVGGDGDFPFMSFVKWAIYLTLWCIAVYVVLYHPLTVKLSNRKYDQSELQQGDV